MTTDQQRGNNMARYYQDLIDNPVFLVQPTTDALKELVSISKKGLTPSQLLGIAGIAGPQSSKGWNWVEKGNFYFPGDNGPHYDIRNEWWYLASNWDAQDVTDPEHPIPLQKPISVLSVILRRGTIPHYMRKGESGHTSQVVNGQLSVTIPGAEVEHFHESQAVAGDDSVMNSSPFYITAGENWYFKADNPGSPFPMTAYVKVGNAEITMKLHTVNEPDWFYEGDNGCAPCIYGLGYRYYSWPNIFGQLTMSVGNKKYSATTGQAWMDHKWGSAMNPLGYVNNTYLRALSLVQTKFSKDEPSSNTRWNWFFFQLNDNTQITSALLPAPKVPESGKGPFKLTNTTIIDSSGIKPIIKNIKGTVTYNDWIIQNGTTYALGWSLEFPEIKLKLLLTPTVNAQFGGSGSGDEYYEGGVMITGTKDGNPIKGIGFAEMIAYQSDDDQIKNVLQLLNSNADINIFKAKRPNLILTIGAILYLLTPILIFISLIIMVTVLGRKQKNLKTQIIL